MPVTKAGDEMPKTPSEGRQHAQQDARNQHDHRADHAEIDGDAGSLLDRAQDQPVAVDRAAQIALHHLPQPLAVLDDERIIQMVALAQIGERLGVGRACTEQGAHGIAGREMHQREHAEGDDEQQRHGDRQPHQDEVCNTRSHHRGALT